MEVFLLDGKLEALETVLEYVLNKLLIWSLEFQASPLAYQCLNGLSRKYLQKLANRGKSIILTVTHQSSAFSPTTDFDVLARTAH